MVCGADVLSITQYFTDLMGSIFFVKYFLLRRNFFQTVNVNIDKIRT